MAGIFLLAHDQRQKYVNAVINLVEQEASSTPTQQQSAEVSAQLLSQAQEAVERLASIPDSNQCLSINTATCQHRELLESRMLYLGQYRTSEATKVHESESSLIITAEDVTRKKKVALKVGGCIV